MCNGQMPRESKNEGLQQVATRVSDEARRVLELAAVAEQKSMTDLLRPTVEQYAEQLAREPEIAEIRAQARKYEARKKGVALLPRGRPRGGRPSKRSSASD
jgi:uncharacterized protein (DUF1778 family)